MNEYIATYDKQALDFTELSKLWLMLAQANVEMTVVNCFDGYQIKGEGWDTILHSGSFGAQVGLLETMADCAEDVVGWMTADETFEFLKKGGYVND